MAQILTYPEQVSRYNIEKLRKCVSNGIYTYPGARYVRRNGNEFYLGGSNRKAYADILQYGDIVERHLEDGDVLLFKRQPNLHRMFVAEANFPTRIFGSEYSPFFFAASFSLQNRTNKRTTPGRAKVMSWRTLRFNESVCNPYNADFDGDEMNIHAPQTEEARAEAVLLKKICAPRKMERSWLL
ncbi:hypothetical protein L3X38_018947 [Prunus dulcis]|uniref:DNA-directed RNA polymerase n=1 Tax=Prunus dulcis TaxID=3755 RepID=A0AAD4WA08_PRUDU|nr:hypothetical protein L3X38_018947 [Prunus dulcis]